MQVQQPVHLIWRDDILYVTKSDNNTLAPNEEIKVDFL